jgi:two-component system phosphate regulon sensor histidine kinase PhoR
MARLGVRARLVVVVAALVAVLAVVLARVVAGRVEALLASGRDAEALALFEQAFAALSLGAVGVAVAVSVVLGYLLLRRVEGLTRIALAMSEGDLELRAPTRGGDDLARLGEALNKLAGALSSTLERVRDDRDLLASILDGMTEGVLVIDSAGRIVLANRALRAMALMGDDVVGKTVLEATRNAELKGALDQARTSREAVVRELELGRVLVKRLLVRVSTLSSEEGSLVAVLHDVTDLRRLETIRTDFVANVSHELRTPITAIATSAETLLGGALAGPDAVEFVELIDRNATRLRQLVDDLLDLSKIEAKHYRLALVDVEPAGVLTHTRKLLAESARKRRVTVDVRVLDEAGQPSAPEAVRVRADRRALEQVVSNLLDNAIKYAGEGAHVVLSVRDGEPTTIVVSDDGAGIPRAHQGRIFERFYRVDPGRSRELGGTGLGLSIVKHLVELMGGTIEVESELGRGSSFTVRLPRGPGRELGSSPQAAASSPSVARP